MLYIDQIDKKQTNNYKIIYNGNKNIKEIPKFSQSEEKLSNFNVTTCTIIQTNKNYFSTSDIATKCQMFKFQRRIAILYLMVVVGVTK